MIWGAIALVMIVFGATLMKDAPKQEVKTSNGVVEKDYTLAESMRKPQYWMLAVMFLTACMSGLYVIGVAKISPKVWHTLMWFPQPMQSLLFPSPTFQVVWFWGYCLTKSPESVLSPLVR